MRKQQKSILVLATIAVFVTTAAFLPGPVHAGNLEPSAPPGSTMHTLDEIYNIVLETNSKVGGGQCEGASVAKTGQTTSYAAGDDGDLQKGLVWSDPRFTDHEDGTVTDNLTGLMWTKDANIYGAKAWTDALSDCTSCTEGGHSDWRLPNVRELQSLIDYGRYNLALPAGHPFSNVQSVTYWSSTTFADATFYAWDVYLFNGYVDGNPKDNSFYVWCVRGGQ